MDDIRKANESTHDNSGGSVSPVSPGDESPGSSASPPYSQDLRSVLVTSVLNLETLDLDLYR